jgi:FkbM family methyltransferase
MLGRSGWVIAGVLVGIGAVGVMLQVGRDAVPARRADPPRVKVVDLPATVDGQVELFKTELGRVLVHSPSDRHARSRHFHRHTHETSLALGGADAIYTPPFAIGGGDGATRLVFAAAPEDEPVYLDEAAAPLPFAEAERFSLTETRPARWMLDKLEKISVVATHTLGPYTGDAAIYVVAGRGELRADRVYPVGPRQLAWLASGTSVDVAATSPLTLLVFDPASTTVSPILKEGTKVYSQDDEELVIRDFFRDRRQGVFLDVGAGHYQRYSTTYYLEQRLGWSGVAIDALSEYAEDYRKHRKRTTFVNALITDKARGPQKFYRAEGFPEVSAVSKQVAEEQARAFTGNGAVSERTVPSSSLDAVLDRLEVKKIDFVSMDIEEHEPEALAGFDIARFRPALVCVEAHPTVRDALWRYFRQHGYVRQDQYLAWDSANWYFARPRR